MFGKILGLRVLPTTTSVIYLSGANQYGIPFIFRRMERAGGFLIRSYLKLGLAYGRNKQNTMRFEVFKPFPTQFIKFKTGSWEPLLNRITIKKNTIEVEILYN